MTQEHKDFRYLKPGDEVIINDQHGMTLRQVDKITPKGFIKIGSSLYDPANGRQRGANEWHSVCLRDATEDRKEAIIYRVRKKELYNKIKDIKLGNLKNEVLEDIYKVIYSRGIYEVKQKEIV